MFKLVKTTPTGSDETAGYIVLFGEDKPCTVNDFINEVLDKNPRDYGGINIYSSYKYSDVFQCGVKYGYGKLEISTLPEKTLPRYLNKQIISASASGGWSLMNYTLYV